MPCRPPPPARPSLALLLLLGLLASASLPWLVAPSSAPGPHITELNVLLPPRMKNPVHYRLQATGGCFSWSWDHHDILTVQPEFNISSKCSMSAHLISVSPYIGPKETAVYATDLQSGMTIRCKVFIDKISRIQIFHHANKIDLDELATLQIRAFDSEENVFSSLVGLEFLWKFVPEPLEDDSTNHLIHVPLKETPLTDCGGFCGDLDTQIELEQKGVGSDLYVVKGVAIGHEVVTAQLLEPDLEHVSDSLILTVAEAMSLDPPSPVFVTIGALVHYCLRVIRGKTTQVIALPSPHHKWHAMNSSVAWIDGMIGEAHALSLGKTDIVVEDTRVSGHAQTSSMHVVIPNKMWLYITPVYTDSFPYADVKATPSSDVWYVFPGQEYIIEIKVFSEGADRHRIFITEKNELKLESNTLEYWNLHHVPKDGSASYNWRSTRLLKPISPGKGTLTASLIYQRENSKIPESLGIVQEVYVCSKVQILGEEDDVDFSKVIRLPWAHGVHQEVQLRATGGCGRQLQDYKWFTSDKAVVTISDTGTVQALGLGEAAIKVVSVFDSLNYAEVLIEVSLPSTMTLLPIFPLEVVVGTQVHAAITLRTSDGNYFSRCDAFTSSVRWKVITESGSFKFLSDITPEWAFFLPHTKDSILSYGCPCAWTSLYASSVGRAMLEASLSLESASLQSLDGPSLLRAASPIAAYYPLTVCQTGSGNQFGGYWVDLSRTNTEFHDLDCTKLDELYLVPGSAMHVSLLGGPERWDQTVDFIEAFHLLADKNLISAPGGIQQHESSNGQKLYQISCQRVGKFQLFFSRGNLVGNNHPSPIAEVYLSVICSFPSSITVIANEPENKLEIIHSASHVDRGPGRLRVTPVTVSNGRTIRLAAISIHDTGRAFANSSSLNLKWELSGCEELAHWNESNREQLNGANWERFLVLLNASGLCTARATVIGLSSTVATTIYDEVYSWLEGSERLLTDAVTLQLVSSLRILPESVLLLNDPEAKVNLSISGGTCFLDAYTNDMQVVQIVQPSESTKCTHLTLCARGLGTSLVVVHDIGLSPPAVASAMVKVANADWINIMSQEEIYLLEGTARNLDILAGTEDGTTFHPSQYMYMNIKVHIEDDILELVKKEHSSRDLAVSGTSISIIGRNCGVTTIYVSVSQLSGYEITSQLVKVEVYRPLQLHPEYVYLVPGASYVLTVKDGPRHGSFVKYTSMHKGIAEVENSLGKLFANAIGNSTVSASVFGKGGALISEAFGQVEVGIPETMTLEPQSNQLCVGCKMPIFPTIPKGDLFSFFDVCHDYTWTVGNKKIVGFSTYGTTDSHTCGGKIFPCYLSDKANHHVNVLIGRSAGKTEVSVIVSCGFIVSGSLQQVSYNASIFLEVVPDPPLSLGIPITWVIPPFYTTSELLPRFTNLYAQADSHTRKSISYSVLRLCGRNDHLRDGINIDGGKISTKESKDLACIQAKDLETGRMDIACCVRVAEVSQVRISAADSSFHVVHLAIDSKLELTISYCDNLGYPFAEASGVVPIDFETNYPDVLSMFMLKGDNATNSGIERVIIQGKKPGNALVRLSLNHNPKKADFMLVSVGAQLKPINPAMHVGQHLNFSIVGGGIDGSQSGKWLSGNSSILSVHASTGEGYAVSEGTTQVFFDSSEVKFRTTVSVMKVNQISLDAPKEMLTNVGIPVKGYMFSVTFSSSARETQDAIETHIKVPYDCRVEPSFIGYSKPWIDHVTGKAYCLFFPYSPEHLLRIISNSDMSSKVMFVTVFASLQEPPNVSATARSSFVGGFSVADKGLSLTPTANKSTIQVIGNTDIEMFWKAKDLLSVRRLSEVSSSVAGYAEYEVRVLKNQGFKDKIVFVLPANDQKVEIDVCYELGERTEPSKLSGISWLAVILCAVLLIITVLVVLSLLDRPDRSASGKPMAPSSSPVSGRETPNQGSAGNIPSSPGTPQPFMEYVRRTIDETPYYKRDIRRKFDPQYTY